MNSAIAKFAKFTGLLVVTCGLVAILNACASASTQQPTQVQPINIDGSSTVYPITQAIVAKFNSTEKEPVKVTATFSGTGGGFKKFCAGETDINNASRPIQTKEMEACKQAGIAYIELPVAFDALTLVVNPKNDWAKDITVEELRKIWEPEAQKKITKWNQIRSTYPNRSLNLYGPGTNSGTYDYFTEAIVGKAGASRSDYIASEDDDVLVKGVSNDPDALGYFGFAYYEANRDKLKALAIDNGSGAVSPSREVVEKNKYRPLTRPLFIYVKAKSAQENRVMVDFIKYYLEQAPEVVKTVGYVPLPAEGYHIDEVAFYQGKVGTVFEGKSEFNLTIGEVLRKKAQL